ncbi:MAG: hypothetical protein KGH63_00400 [Candidatus Micrarchaeota archaeon]|nr:hypothetical protein [Candidatus Micrarchaeota archaeon]
MDLLLAFLILVSLLSPLLSYAVYADHRARETAFARQQLSILLQEAQLVYGIDAASRAPQPDGTLYAQAGYLDMGNFAQAQQDAPALASSIGLARLELSLSPPGISNPNQVCVPRLMLVRPPPLPGSGALGSVPLLPSISIPPTPQRVWVCGW